MPAIIGSGLITMLLTPLPQWPGALLLGLCAAAVYQVTGCLVMTSVFHMGFLVAQTLLLHGPNPQQVLSAAVMVLLLAAALVGCWKRAKLWERRESIKKCRHQGKKRLLSVDKKGTRYYNIFCYGLIRRDKSVPERSASGGADGINRCCGRPEAMLPQSIPCIPERKLLCCLT